MSDTPPKPSSSLQSEKKSSTDTNHAQRISLTKSKKPTTLKTTYPVSRANYKDDGLKISPLFLIGAFLIAIGVGFLIGPQDPVTAPAYQTWSVIILGFIIMVPGLIRMSLDYLASKKNKKNTE